MESVGTAELAGAVPEPVDGPRLNLNGEAAVLCALAGSAEAAG